MIWATIWVLVLMYCLATLIRCFVALYFIDRIGDNVKAKFREFYIRAKSKGIGNIYTHNFYCLDLHLKDEEVFKFIFNIFKPLNIDDWLSDDLKHFLYEV